MKVTSKPLSMLSSSSARDLAGELDVSQQTIVNKLHQFNFVNKKKKESGIKLWTMLVYTLD
ncbi:hypothetical protein KIN20_006810 [Parelaphostrongylus tenuis]|uniref:Uncharacterized protein n=1 Tax=Parelaphostrongylus tenuis TaxID=148309 RepID=A0AAD5MN45_PARTN|nr:hypothetical protein KIN20_006810 [Parelaphostrongylus tenuis]